MKFESRGVELELHGAEVPYSRPDDGEVRALIGLQLAVGQHRHELAERSAGVVKEARGDREVALEVGGRVLNLPRQLHTGDRGRISRIDPIPFGDLETGARAGHDILRGVPGGRAGGGIRARLRAIASVLLE